MSMIIAMSIFKSILLMSAVGSLLALCLLIIKPVTRKMFGPVWQYYIWLTVLIVMVLPIRFVLPEKTAEFSKIIAEQVQTVIPKPQTAAVIPVGETLRQMGEQALPETETANDIFKPLCLIWFLGAALALIVKIVKYFLFLRMIYKNSEADTSVVGIPTRLKLRRTSMLDAPLIVGLLNTVLFLPYTEMSDDDMSFILRHELTHYKRNDILYKWFAMTVKCIHWFNPLIYAVSKQIDLDCEIACDFAVTGKMTETEKNGYMNMILAMLANSGNNQRALTTQMISGKNTLKMRFNMIKKNISVSKNNTAVSFALAIVLLTGTEFVSGAAAGRVLSAYDDELAASVIAPKEKISKEIGQSAADIQKQDNITAPQTESDNLNNITAEFAETGTEVREESIDNVQQETAEVNVVPEALPAKKIKASSVADEVYLGFEMIDLPEISVPEIEKELNTHGISKSSNARVDLKKNYALMDCNSENTQVTADKNGNISVYIAVDNDNLFDVSFTNADTNEEMGQFCILANNENVYSFIGFEHDKVYNMEVRSKTKGDWNINGSYIIY